MKRNLEKETTEDKRPEVRSEVRPEVEPETKETEPAKAEGAASAEKTVEDDEAARLRKESRARREKERRERIKNKVSLALSCIWPSAVVQLVEHLLLVRRSGV